MTPYLTGKAIPALIDGRNTFAWMQAALVRAKKMPKLESLMNRKTNENVHTKLKDLVTSYNANVRDKKSRRKNHGR